MQLESLIEIKHERINEVRPSSYAGYFPAGPAMIEEGRLSPNRETRKEIVEYLGPLSIAREKSFNSVKESTWVQNVEGVFPSRDNQIRRQVLVMSIKTQVYSDEYVF